MNDNFSWLLFLLGFFLYLVIGFFVSVVETLMFTEEKKDKDIIFDDSIWPTIFFWPIVVVIYMFISKYGIGRKVQRLHTKLVNFLSKK